MDAINHQAERLEAAHANAPMNLQTLLGAFRRRLLLFLAVAMIVAGTVAFITMKSPLVFTATATVLIDQHKRDVLRLDTINGAPPPPTESAGVDTEAEILRSRALASKVVDQLHLDRDPEFNGALRPRSLVARLMSSLGRAPADDGEASPAVKAAQYEGVVSSVLSGLAVRRVGLTYTIAVGYTARQPNKAAAIANAFAQVYLTQDLEAQFEASRTATAWIDGRLAELRTQVQAADTAVQQYKIANNLLSAQGATLTEQEISNMDLQVAQSRAQVAEQDARLKTAESQLRNGSNGGDVGEALNNPLIQSLRGQRVTASAHLADLQTRYGDRHPEILKARDTLAEIDAQIQNEIQRVISNLKAQSAVAHMRSGSIEASANQTRGTLAVNNRASVRLAELQRDDDAVRSLYDAFLSRYKETTAKEGIQQSDARMLSAAKPPTGPSAPNKRLDLFLAMALGIAAGLASVLAAELLRRGVSSSDDLERRMALPALGEIPTLASTLPLRGGGGKLDPIAYVVAKPLSRFAESFRNLRAAILSSRTGQLVKVIAITSSQPGEGKTTTAICLARTMALAGASVVLVDCDLRQRALNRMLAAEPKVGLLEVLNGTATLDQALAIDKASGAHLLTLTSSAFTPRDVFGSEAMRRLLDDLRRRFDVVLLDTAPALAVADTRILCPQADAVLFLMRWRTTSRRAATTALRSLGDGGAFVAGVALTQVNVREQMRSGEGAAYANRAYNKYYSS